MDNKVLKNLFFFDSMLTPKIITFVYWLMLLGAVGAGINLMQVPFYGGFFKGLALMVGVAILARIWCELLIVLFKIHESARQIADATPAAPTQPTHEGAQDNIHTEYST